MDFTIIPELERQIFTYLRSLDCCMSCCLRLVGTRSSECFRNYKDSSQLFSYMLEDNTNQSIPCIACLGILQHDIQEQTLKQILDSAILSGCDSSTFTCALSIPISLSLRERFLQISLTRKFQLSENQLYNLKLRTQNIKEVWKLQVLPKIEVAIHKQLMSGPITSLFTIDITYIHGSDESDCKKFLHNYAEFISHENKHHSKIYSRNNIEKLLNNIEDEEFLKCFFLSSLVSPLHVTIGEINCFHGSIFVGGRYDKLSRHLSQTPWYINGKKKMDTSVQDLLCNRIMEYTRADSLKFLSSGREDVDVRTINGGRPFAVELVNPKITKISENRFAEIVEEINASTNLVKITCALRILCQGDLKRLKEGENIKTKFYRALCISRHKSRDTVNLEQFNNMKNMKIIQNTPIRVLHRRPLTPRVRILHEMRARWLTIEEITKIQGLFGEFDNHFMNQLFVFDVKAQAGTYVKEFVHGDFGRTQPNLCDILGGDIDIVALDVTGINIDWP